MRTMKITYPGLLAIAMLLFASLAHASSLPDFTELAERSSPAVVNISTEQRIKQPYHKRRPIPDLPEGSPFEDLFKRFFGDEFGEEMERDSHSLGSGFIISKDGYVLTNHHVIKDADEIIVRLSDRKSFKADLIGSDAKSDVALLKIDADDLPTVKLGKSSDLKVGEWVLAIGSPFGFDHTVTAGIVSAKGRSLPSENYVPFIQTDVAINPGNSGGPLFNLEGEVVGINSQIYSRTGGFMGLSFSIPIELAMNVVDQLKERGHVSRGYLGVLIQDVDRNLADSFGLDHPRGALVARVLADSPAEKAGLQPGDIILEFNDTRLLKSSQLPPLVGMMPAGRASSLRVLREGKEITLKLVIGELPDEEDETVAASAPAKQKEVESDRLGLVLKDLTDKQREEAGVPADQGILVGRANEGVAYAAGIRSGDIILMAAGRKIHSTSDFRDLVKDLPDGKTIALLVHKKSGPAFIALQMPK